MEMSTVIGDCDKIHKFFNKIDEFMRIQRVAASDDKVATTIDRLKEKEAQRKRELTSHLESRNDKM